VLDPEFKSSDMTEIDFDILPNFLLIGAAKSGTTSLHEALAQHPQIFCTKIKEAHFFSEDKRYRMGIPWYQKTFFAGASGYPCRGESSPSYLVLSDITAPRIKKAYQDRPVKMIAILRDPVQRAYSHYYHRIRSGLERMSFETALARDENRPSGQGEWLKIGYYRWGCYASLLQPFLDTFPRTDISILLFEDFRDRYSETMAGLAAFLGVDSGFPFRPVQSNPAELPISDSLHSFLQHPSGVLHDLLRPISHRLSYSLRHRLKKGLIQANLRQQSYPPMKKETERRLRERYLGEIERLEAILGRDLSAWKSA
jgi:hypothetical protein